MVAKGPTHQKVCGPFSTHFRIGYVVEGKG